MTSTPQRYALAALILVGVWILTYWLWPAPGEGRAAPGVTFAPESAATAAPETAPEPLPVVRDPLLENDGARPPTTTPDESSAPVEQFTQQSATADSAPVVAPRFTEYTVERNDDMWKIAQKVYGDRDRWDAVAKANPTVDPQKLRPGQVLRIAVDPDNIQGVPLGAGPPPAPDANPTEHVVADGETLSGIAQSLYGKSSLWRVIYDANRHLLSTPQDLRPGMRLLIPPAPAGAGQ